MTRVQGHCPMGCGSTLFLGDGGYVTCSYIECPEPDAAATILDEKETDHVVVLEEGTFSIQHPLRERTKGELFDCGLHEWLKSLSGPPRVPGRYSVFLDPAPGGEWIFMPLPAAAVEASR